MTKEEAQKWGLILLAYGFGDKCGIVVKKKGINTEPISELNIVDSGDHTISENDYEILERSSPACPPGFSLNPIRFEYEEKDCSEYEELKGYLEKVIKFPKEQVFEVAKIFIKAAISSKNAEADYFKIVRFEKEI